jgi:D-3-phosphoglycerate dehydrogenase
VRGLLSSGYQAQLLTSLLETETPITDVALFAGQSAIDEAAVEIPCVVVADAVAREALTPLEGRARLVFRHAPGAPDLPTLLATADALVVRSETLVTPELLAAAPRLKVIGRAGAGVDNIDLPAATQRGIVVVNAPGGNTIAAAEHTVAMLLSVTRRIPAADAALKRGEWQRSKFVGHELRGKTLGIVGLGRVGYEVARRLQSFEMRVVCYDPYVTAEFAQRHGFELAELRQTLSQADYITVHTPLTESTRGLIGREQLSWLKPTAIVINCARGGIVDEAALVEALDNGTIAAAAIDVFAKEPATDNPLTRHPKVVATPHLGASTVEAQLNVGLQVAEQLLQVLEGKPAQFAVNAPALPPEQAELLQPYVSLSGLLGSLATQLSDGRFRGVVVSVGGELATTDTSVFTAAALRGLLAPISSDPVTFANAQLLARQRGLHLVEERNADAEPYTSLLALTLQTEQGSLRVAGTIVNGEPHIVGIGPYRLDLVPSGGYLLVTHHEDRPGMIGRVGTMLGEVDVNISSMQVGREQKRGQAIMILSVDEPIAPELLARLRAVPNMADVRVVQL